MLEPGKDFEIEDDLIIRCVPLTDEARSAFKVLQARLARLMPQLPSAPPVTINIDGVIGPSATMAMQAIALRLSEGSHRELAEYAVLQPEQAIPATAAGAMELAGYLDNVIQHDPHALASPTTPEEPMIDPIQMVKDYFTKRRIIALGATTVGLSGLAIVASASQNRALGRVDRARFLPPSDGSDSFDDDDDDDDPEIEAVEIAEEITPAIGTPSYMSPEHAL